MKNRKRRMESLSFYDHTGISRHLEKMALKGWLIEEITSLGWIYKKIEPQKLHFTVTYYPKASEFDPEPSEAQRRFYDFCEHTGWMLACASAQIQIFYHEQENPIPIETDPVVEVDIIHKACKKSFLPAYALLLLLSIMNGGMFIFNVSEHPIDTLSSPVNLSNGLCWALLFILCAAELIKYFTWHKKAVKAAEEGYFLDTPNTSVLQKCLLIAVFFILAYWIVTFVLMGDNRMSWIFVIVFLCMVTLFFLVNSIKKALKKKKASAGVNRTITMISSFVLSFTMMGVITFFTIYTVSHGFFDQDKETYEHNGQTFVIHNDELPLTLEDIFEVTYDGYTKERRANESLLLGEFVMKQHPRFDAADFSEMPTLDYTIVLVKAPFLYNWCKEQMYYEEDDTKNETMPDEMKNTYHSQDAALWNADEVYRLYSSDEIPMHRYLLCYDDRIIELSLDWELTSEQISIIADKLSK